MTETSQVWDGILLGDATVAPYSAAEWASRTKLLQGLGAIFPNYGVLDGTGDGTYSPLRVQAKSPASTNVEVEIGAALVAGYLYQNTAALTLTVSANASGNARIDTLVLRVDFVAQTVRAVIKQGTPAGSPVRPALQQDAVIWEIPLADIAVANGFSTLAQSTITQRQRFVNTRNMGWQLYAYPLNYVYGAVLGSAGGVALPPAYTILVPVFIGANMLFQDVIIRVNTVLSIAYEWGWDLYIEDTNDGNTSENFIRRVAQSNGNATGSLPGVSSSLPALGVQGGAIPLSPGYYWLAVQGRHATNTIVLDNIGTGNAFDAAHYRGTQQKTTTNPNGQTLDAVTGWSTGVSEIIPCLIMRGRVFGQIVTTP